MTRTEYPTSVLLDGRVRWVVWVGVLGTGVDEDVVLLEDGRVLVRDEASGLPPTDEKPEGNPELDLDEAVRWLRRKTLSVPCDGLLTAWNLANDVARSLGVSWGQDRAVDDLGYTKLYWGTNPPVFTPEGCHFTPRWDARQLRRLRVVVQDAVGLLRAALGPQP